METGVIQNWIFWLTLFGLHGQGARRTKLMIVSLVVKKQLCQFSLLALDGFWRIILTFLFAGFVFTISLNPQRGQPFVAAQKIKIKGCIIFHHLPDIFHGEGLGIARSSTGMLLYVREYPSYFNNAKKLLIIK